MLNNQFCVSCYFYKYFNSDKDYEYESNDCEVFELCRYYNNFQDDMQKKYSWHIVNDKLVLGEVAND